MALDITGLILIALFFLRGYMKGIIVATFSVLAILLGLLVSLKLSQSLASWMLEKGFTTSGWAPILSYVVLFVAVVWAVNLVAKMLQKAIEGMMLGIFNKIAGGILYGFLGAVLWSSLLWLGGQSHLISPETVSGSKTYVYIAALAPWFFNWAGSVLPFVKDTFGNLQHFFNSVNQHPADVGTH